MLRHRRERVTRRPGTIGTSLGAVAAAALSSACCWLPMLAIALGFSSAGVGAFFEAWRLPFVLLSVVMLGAGFYLAYRRPRCGPGEACETPNPRLRRMNRGALWLTSLLVVAFAFFPEYVGAFHEPGEGETTPAQTGVRYRIDGMTCRGCEAHVREAVGALPGVQSVSASYAQGLADVVWDAPPDHDAVGRALTPHGYTATPIAE